MNFKKGDKSLYIPTWAIIVGALVIDNVVVNICKATVSKKQK